jgi:hypothetical protein
MKLFSPRTLIALFAGIATSTTAAAFDTFTVTTSADNGNNATPTVGSLRWAIQQANANINLSTINFAVSGCPVLMNMGGTVLPDITTDVVIDGYSAAGSSVNTSFGRFDATLCIILNGSGTLATGLHKSGIGHLEVSGLGFAGFSDAAIRIDSSSGTSNVTGNQIGGFALLAQNKDGVRISATAAQTIVGGDTNPAQVNLIVGNTGTGVQIDSSGGNSFVSHDLIGLGPDGVSPNGNNIGVFVFNSASNTVQDCFISNNLTQGVLIAGTGSLGTWVSRNNIGTTSTGLNAPNGSEGVQITFGAATTTVGATLVTDNVVSSDVSFGNFIYANGAAVWVTSSAGVRNSALANHEMYSAILGLPVDLGGAGPTANDNLDADPGPNELQNYPVMLHAYRTETAEWVEGTLDTYAGEEFRLDLYWSPGSSTGRGNAIYFSGIGTSGMTDSAGHAHFWVRLPAAAYPSVARISGTATRTNGETSEMGDAGLEIVGDMIFRDDFAVLP